MKDIKVEATWVTLSQVADHGTVSVMYMKQHNSRGNRHKSQMMGLLVLCT